MQDHNRNKRIAKNTCFLYVRMLFSMVISLYTSRVILKTLGIEDFGLYNVVAGVVSMFSFLTVSMGSATSRFLTYELGNENHLRLQNVFSAAVTIHLIIALCVLLLGETLGLWFLQYKLVIPESRMYAANIVYQFAIFSSILSIIQVPYSAMIMANERMNVYAYIEIVNVLLKLIVVFLLVIISTDKLIVYSFLLSSVTFVVLLMYWLYCRRRLSGCSFHLSWNKEYVYPMLSFSGWDLYGNASVLARTQGVNILLNMFFGSVLNAASGIATQVQNAVMSFASNVLSAIRPQIIKSYTVRDDQRMLYLINKASVYTSILLLLFTFPLLVDTEFILTLWLDKVPPYSVVLCRYVLLFNLFANLSSVVISGIHATGKIKRPSIINGTFYLSVIPYSYVLFKMGGEPQIAYIYNIFAVVCGMLSNIWTLHLFIPSFSLKKYFTNILCKILLVGSIVLLLTYIFSLCFEVGWIRLFCITSFSTILLLLATYYILMDSQEKKQVIMKIKQICNV